MPKKGTPVPTATSPAESSPPPKSKPKKKPTKVEGVDYSPEGIEELRQDLIQYRDRALAAMPEGAQMAVTLSHAIALLSFLAESEHAI